MMKNYVLANKRWNFTCLLCILFLSFLFSQKANSQCVTPPVGCSNTDLTNFGVDSDNNATTIEYDNFVSSYHSTIVRTSDGSLQTWGEDVGNDGVADVLSPLTINSTNFPALGTAIPLKAALGSNGYMKVQGILLATDGLYAWSKEGVVLDASITSSTTFQKITINGNTNGLPVGVVPGDVKMMFGTFQTLTITTCSGDVWVISQNANLRGNGAAGNATTWYKVTTDAGGNPFLSNIVVCRGVAGSLMALKSDGTVYTWGNNVYKGNNTAIIAAQNRATQMTLPTGISPKMIGATVNSGTTNHSYYVLAVDGNLYALGENGNKQLGDLSIIDRQTWVQPRYPSTGNPVMDDIKWFSSQEHDSEYSAVNVINSSKNLYAFGQNAFALIGGAGDPSNPVIPTGVTIADGILAVETGGHTSMLVKNCQSNFGYVGHRINGSMGNGSTASATEGSYNFTTAAVQICGAESAPAILPVSAGSGPNSNYCSNSFVVLAPSPAGGTLSVTSGPGTLTGNTLNFTGIGTVAVEYSVTNTCGAASIATRNFITEDCSTDLKVVKTVDNATPNVGSNVIFTLTASNAGPSSATGVNVKDILPAGYTFVSATPSTGTWTSPEWSIGTLANGASASITIEATVNASGSYSNTATVTANEPDPTPGNNTSTTVPVPVVQSNVSVVKTVDNATPNVGSNVIFTLTASNAGPSSATGVNVKDILPAGYTFVSATPSTGTWTSPEWSIGTLANGASASITIEATVNASGSYSNTATVTANEPDPTPGNNTSTTVPIPVNIIDAVTETQGPINGLVGGTTPTLVANDTLNGTPVVIGNNPGEVILTGVSVPTGLTLNPNGTVTVGANTPAGSYNVEYRICEINNPGNCDTVISVVTVTAPAIDAVTETQGPINGLVGGTTPTLVANDTLNGAPVVIGNNPGEVTLTEVSIPTGLTLNPNGIVTVGVNTPVGSYNVEYRICEVNNPGNCDTVISVVTVTAPAIDAVTETQGPINGLPGGTTPTLVANDTLNGTPVVIGNNPGEVILTGVSVPTGLTLNPNGTVTVGANTPAGSYNVEYRICEVNNPGNCDTVISVVTVTAPAIDAVTETQGPINGLVGGTTPTLVANDTLNGAPVVIGNNPGEVTLTGVSVPTGLTLNPNGIVTVGVNTPVGSYNVEYRICEVNNPGNCDTVISVVTVTAPAIDAVTETQGPINGLVGGTTPTLVANDTLNGTPVVIGNNPGEVTLTGVNVPTGLTLNPNGTVTVGVNTPVGSYNVEYTICEVNNPGNCDTVISVVTVTAPAIDAVTETQGPINGLVGGTTPTLVANDTLNGTPVVIGNNPGEVILTGVSVPTGLTLNPNGTVTVGANTPAGSYNVEYRICEVNNPGNCDTVISVVTVTAPAIDAVTETQGPINGLVGGTTPTLVANDTLNGTPVVIGNNPGEVTLTGVSVPTGLTLNPNGIVTVGVNTPVGSYNVEYRICEVNNPGNCDTVISVVTVTTPAIDAVTETQGPINGLVGGTTPTLVANDTLNGTPVVIGNNPGEVTLTGVSVPTGLTLNPNGTVTVGVNTPAGSYNVEYRICEVNNPGNCDTVISVVTVTAPAIDAVTETQGPINGLVGGTTPTLVANDTLNGTPVVIGNNPGEVILTGVSVPTGLTLNPNGTVTVGVNTPAGSYNVEYTICEVNNPGNCDTVISVVTVTAPAIDAVTETQGPINGLVGGTTPTLVANDTLNGTPVVIGNNPGEVILTGVNVPTGLTLNPNGTVTVGANTPAGSYNVEYTICEVNNPGNCDTVISVVTVTASAIDAVTETQGSINGLVGGTTPTLVANDTLNGAPVVIGNNPGEVTLTGVNVPTGLTLNPNGTVTVGANTPAGSYNVEYRICEVNNPGNCDTVISVVTVTAPAIDAVTETQGPINGLPGGTTPTLVANDILNGTPVVIGNNPGEVTLTGVNVPTGLTLNPNGTVTVGANTPAGSYNVEYTICEVNNPGNCDTVISVVTVTAPAIDANDDTINIISGSNGSNGIINVFGNDTFNGDHVGLNNVILTVDSPALSGHIILNSDGTVNLKPGTPAGTYEITYTICEKLNAGNCSTAVVNVVVGTINDIDVYTHMTPNGDGINDVFYIDGITKYPNNTVEIYNRWGVLVYKADGYNNINVSFDGKSRGRTTVNANDNLPEGTYFYIVSYTKTDGERKDKSGYLYLNR